jgi:hypothetical protein
MYSFVLLRTLHFIVHLRLQYPKTKIFICKFDLDAAYQRCHLSGTTAAECLTIHDSMLLMALHMTFGGSPCPSLWGYISDTLADICNTLIHNPSWNHSSLYDVLSSTLETPLSFLSNIPFHEAKSLAVRIPHNNIGKVDIYIDDTIGIALDFNDNVNRVSKAVPLAIHAITRPINEFDPIPRKEIISMKKFIAEGRMEESKLVLGWITNTHTLTAALPQDKHKKWTEDIDKMITSGRSNFKSLEKLIGRLNHAANILPTMRHFIGRIYKAL